MPPEQIKAASVIGLLKGKSTAKLQGAAAHPARQETQPGQRLPCSPQTQISTVPCSAAAIPEEQAFP